MIAFFGNKDNIKIEINYMNRNHLLEPQILKSKVKFIESISVLNLNIMELFASKIKALIERCTIRDVYDVYLMIINNVFSKTDFVDLRKLVVFHLAIGQTTNKMLFN